jgi:hypothetical protein
MVSRDSVRIKESQNLAVMQKYFRCYQYKNSIEPNLHPSGTLCISWQQADQHQLSQSFHVLEQEDTSLKNPAKEHNNK